MKNIMSKKQKLGASLTALAFSLITSANVRAQSCTVPPTCAELGYVRSASECATIALKCPFDNSKYYCLTASELETLTPSNCAVGDILYSDKSCSTSIDTTKTAIGVIFNPAFRLAIALDTEQKVWSTTSFEVPVLTNYSSSPAADWAGRANTTTVINYCTANSKSCPAFEYVNSYTTAGTNAGDWYLPAMGELYVIYTNKGVLNTALSRLGGTQLPDSYHWSSSEHSNTGAWGQIFNNGYISSYSKPNANYYVRPVLAF